MKTTEKRKKGNLVRVSRVCIAVAALCLAAGECARAQASVWTGEGGSKRWTDAANWENGRAPVISPGVDFVFDAGEGLGFSFGEPFRAASVTFAEKSPTFSITAPEVAIGGSAAEDVSDGWVVEHVFMPGKLANLSASTQLLNAPVRLGWDSVFDAAGGNITIKGGLSGEAFALKKNGTGDVSVVGGKVALGALELNAGRFVLSECAASIGGASFGQKTDTSMVFANGASLQTPAEKKSELEVRPNLVFAKGKASAPDAPVWDADGRTVRLLGPKNTFDGVTISNANNVSVAVTAKNTRAETVFSGGTKLLAKAFYVGDAYKHHMKLSTNVVVKIVGAGAAAGPRQQTRFDLGGGALAIGRRFDSITVTSGNALEVSNHAVIDNVGDVVLSSGYSSPRNSMKVSEGARIGSQGLAVGYTSVSNTVDVAGRDTRWTIGTRGIKVGYNVNWGGMAHNGMQVRDGARVLSGGDLWVGRNVGRDATATGNHLYVRGGSQFESKGATIGECGNNGKLSTNNVVRIDGAGSVWNAGGDRVSVGYVGTGLTTDNMLVVSGGAMMTNAATFSVGGATHGMSSNNRAIITDGAKLFTSKDAGIGSVTSRNKSDKFGAYNNSIRIGGGKGGRSVWDAGGASIVIGATSTRESTSHDNKLILSPGGAVVNAGALVIGRGAGNTKGNALVLAGGNIVAKSLTMTSENAIDVEITSAAIQPLLVQTDVTFAPNSFVVPRVSGTNAHKGPYPILGWKGKAKDLQNLKLSPKVDKKQWKLEVDEKQKRVILHRAR